MWQAELLGCGETLAIGQRSAILDLWYPIRVMFNFYVGGSVRVDVFLLFAHDDDDDEDAS